MTVRQLLESPARRSLLGQLLDEAGDLDRDWWHTWTADALIDFAPIAPLVEVLAGIATAVRDGGDPDVLIGGSTPEGAFGVADEWLAAGVPAGDVADWLRSGCWSPGAARQLAEAGIGPRALLDDNGRPLHLVEAPDGEQLPVARAVTEELYTVAAAVELVSATSGGGPTAGGAPPGSTAPSGAAARAGGAR